MPTYDAFPELAATILDWLEVIGLSACLVGLVINFYFTLNKGRRYRVAYVLMLICMAILLYVDVITASITAPKADDLVRPFLYISWAYTVWTRSWVWLSYYAQLNAQYENTIEKVQSLENTVIPWKEASIFGAQIERAQKWIIAAVAGIFAIGQLYSNVDRIESLQRENIHASNVAFQKEQKGQDLAAEIKRGQDSLLLVQIVAERKRTERLITEIGATKENSVVNQKLLLSERKRNQQLLQYLKGIEESLKSRLDPIPTIKPKSSNWGKSLSPDRVGNPRYPKNNTFSSAESDPDTTHYARVNVY